VCDWWLVAWAHPVTDRVRRSIVEGHGARGAANSWLRTANAPDGGPQQPVEDHAQQVAKPANGK
jgi:hypothetical protein